MCVIAMRGAIDRRHIADLCRRHIIAPKPMVSKNEQQLPSVVRAKPAPTESGIFDRGSDRRQQRKLCIAIRRGPLPARCDLGRAGIRSGRRAAFGDSVQSPSAPKCESEDRLALVVSGFVRCPRIRPTSFPQSRRMQQLYHASTGQPEPSKVLGVL